MIYTTTKGNKKMKIIIEAESKEIADLVIAIQSRQNKKTDIEINCDTSEIVKKTFKKAVDLANCDTFQSDKE